MPTAAKLICAILLAGIGFATSHLVVWFILSEGTPVGYFAYVNTALGFVLGWRMLGRMVGDTAMVSAMNGVFAGGVMLALGVAIQSIYEMILRSMDLAYSGPEDAVEGALDLAARNFVQLADPVVLGAHFAMAAVAGLLGHVAARRWR